MKEYYAVGIKINTNKTYCIWYTDDIDGVIITNNCILTFQDLEELKLYAYANGFVINTDNCPTYDFDRLEILLSSIERELDCNILLNFWNIMSDCSAASGYPFIGDSDIGTTVDIYNKLFYGCNIDAIKGDASDYIPVWTEDELQNLSRILYDGLRLIKLLLRI